MSVSMMIAAADGELPVAFGDALADAIQGKLLQPILQRGGVAWGVLVGEDATRRERLLHGFGHAPRARPTADEHALDASRLGEELHGVGQVG
jgi:hypothetical protein